MWTTTTRRPAGETLSVDAPGVLANDTDAEDDTLTATGLTQPANGVVTMETDGSFVYIPDTGFVGTDTFTYRANDGTTSSAATTVTITWRKEGRCPNTAPVAVDDAFSTVAGEPLSLAAPGVLANDTDVDGDALTATGLTPAGQRNGEPGGRRWFRLHARRGLRGQGRVHLSGQ